jgi:hypothetical protein
MHRDSAGSRWRLVNLAGNLHGIKRQIEGNAGNAGNNSGLEANPLKIMAGGPYYYYYNNK